MDYRVHGILQARILECWSGLSCPSPGDLSNPENEPRSPALQVDSLLAEPPGKPKNTGVSSLSLLQWIFPTQELNRGLLQCRQILYQLKCCLKRERRKIETISSPLHPTKLHIQVWFLASHSSLVLLKVVPPLYKEGNVVKQLSSLTVQSQRTPLALEGDTSSRNKNIIRTFPPYC